MIYFGADLHFDHKHILNFCDRPYTSVAEMTESMLCDIERVVSRGDIVYLLGDIQFCSHTDYLDRLQRIRGVEFHLIIGNHDSSKLCKHALWKSVSHHKVIKVNGAKVILCHYPIQSWYCMEHGSYHFHGHTHNNASHQLSYMPNRVDVGSDKTKKTISTFDEVLSIMREDRRTHFIYQ